MKKLHSTAVALLMICGVGLTSCAGPSQTSQKEHYVSSQVEGQEAKINLEEVQKAFWESKGADPKDFNSWMGAFEKRVNEIYDGEGVVSIDASRETGKLTVTGYVEDKKEQGFQPGEEKLFSIEQTGDVTDNQLPYRVSGHDGRPYYEGHRSILDSPFVQMMVLSHLMGGFGGRYFTPGPSVVVLRDHRNNFRTTPAYQTQKASNTAFKQTSKSKFGGGSFSSSTTASSKRSWFGGGSSSSTSTRSSGWGGRRSGSGFGWGRRRR